MKTLLVSLLSTMFVSAALACELGDFHKSLNISVNEWQSEDQQALEQAFCKTAAFTGITKLEEIWINKDLMGFEYTHRLTLVPRYRPLNAEPDFRQSLELTANIWVHEYGHAVLKAALLDKYPDWLKSIQRTQDYALTNDKFLKCMANRCPEQRELLGKLMNFWAPGEKDTAYRFTSIYTPYDEMYADIVSALYANSPTAMSDALAYPDEGHDGYKRALRNLSIEHPLSDERNGQPHGLLAYSRNWIWKNMMDSGRELSLTEKTFILKTLELAIEQEVARRMLDGDGSETSAEINLAFVERIKTILQK